MQKIALVVVVGVFLAFRSGLDVAKASELDGDLIVTATRIGNYDYQVTSDLTVINNQAIKDSGAGNIPELLRQYAGIYVYDRSTPKTTVVDIRGFGDSASSNVLFLVNDRKLNSVDLSGPDLMQLPLDAVERIEVLRGAGSVLYGDNAVGGVVNIITKKGADELFSQITSEYGSYGRHRVSAQTSGSLEGFRYFVFAGYDDHKGYREKSDVFSKNANLRLIYEIEDRIDIDLEMGAHKDDTELPGGLDEDELLTLGHRSSTDNNYSRTEDQFIRLGIDVAIGEEVGDLGFIAVDGVIKDRDVFDSFFGNFNSNRDIDQWGILSKYVFDNEILGHDVDFVLGVDVYQTDNKIIGSGSNSDDITISKEEIGYYGFLEFETFEDMYINAGMRHHEAEYDFDDRGSNLVLSQDPDQQAYLIGAKYLYGKGSSFFFNTQRTFRFLATDEWYSTFSGLNTSLKQQKGNQVELGLRHKFTDEVTGNVTGYEMEIENEIYFNPTTFTNDNYDKTRRRGIELALEIDALNFISSDIVDRADIRLGATFQEAEFDGGLNDGLRVPLVPEQQFSHQFNMVIWDNFEFSLHGRYIGKRIIGNDFNNDKAMAQDYYVADARFVYSHQPFKIFFEVNNIFNNDYNTYEIEKNSFTNPLITRDVYPAASRNFNIGCTVTF